MATTIDAALHLLDRQVVDRAGVNVGKVDDLELERRPDGSLVVSAVLCGPLALGPRIGGRLGVWWVSVARRLRPESHGDPVRIGMGAVTDVDTVVRLAVDADQTGTQRLERWCRDKVVAPLPGSDRSGASS